MKSIEVSFLLVMVFVVFSCNVQSIRKARLQNDAEKQQSTQVDSFLYYQTQTLNDPFLESLKVEHDKEQVLHITVKPPAAPPPPKVKQVEGYRVQTFAGIDSLNALVMVNDLKNTLRDSVYFFKEDALFKIQLGDYLYRNDADMKVLDLRKTGIPAAWVVKRLVNIPVETDSAINSMKMEEDYSFKIQVLVTSDLEKAKALADQLGDQFQITSSYILSENLYKIFLGKFASREAAQVMLNKVRQNGYKDAWLVHNQ